MTYMIILIRRTSSSSEDPLPFSLLSIPLQPFSATTAENPAYQIEKEIEGSLPRVYLSKLLNAHPGFSLSKAVDCFFSFGGVLIAVVGPRSSRSRNSPSLAPVVLSFGEKFGQRILSPEAFLC